MGKKLIGHPLSDVTINSILKQKINNFRGCFARNDLPAVLQNGYYVINLDSKQSSGTHWCGFIATKQEIEYFDPFGFPPPNELIERKGNKIVVYSSHSLQNLSASSCGLWVIYYLCHRFRGQEKTDILLRFGNTGSQENEKKLDKWVKTNLI